MPFIGNQPAEAFSSFQKQDFSTSATTSYTLDHPVSNQNEIALFINFVRQEPTAAYTASGTTLTLTSATSSSDDMYCVYLGKAVQTVNPASGSVGSSQVASTIITGQTAETSIATDDTVLIHDTSAGALRKMTRANFVSGVGGDNTPMFSAYKASDQTGLAANQYNKITFTTEEFDPDSAYDASNSKFVAPSAGKYFFNALMRLNPSAVGPTGMSPSFYKNGSLVRYNRQYNEDTQSCEIQMMINLAQNDYVEVYLYYHDDTHTVYGDSGGNNNIFQGFKLIG